MTNYATDTFTRTLGTNQWGTADTGGAWTVNGTAEFSVDGSEGICSTAASTNRAARLDSMTAVADQEGVLRVLVDDFTEAGNIAYCRIETRYQNAGNDYYRFQIQFGSTGSIGLSLRRNLGGTPTTLDTITGILTGITTSDHVRIRWQLENSGSDVICRYRLWKDGDAEPGTWSREYTDTAPGGNAQNAGILQLTLQNVDSSSSKNFKVDDINLADLSAGGNPLARLMIGSKL